MRCTALVALCLLGPAHAVRADRVHLAGGSVVEGKATRNGDQVVVQLGSGELRVPAQDVVRIEAADSDVQQYEQRAARLVAGDIKGLLQLADFCREHDMRDREQQLLRKLIALDSEHVEARTRLGYVREGSRWVLREEQLRAQGFVQYEGRWISPAQQLELEQARARSRQAALERERAQVELERERAELERSRAAPATSPEPAPAPVAWPVYVSPHPYRWDSPGAREHSRPCRERSCSSSSAPEDPRRRPFPIPGAKDPFSYFW